jgi:hypothetical protein
MKASLGFAAAFAFGLLGVLTGFGFAHLTRGPSTASASVDADALARLEARLAAAESRVASVDKLEAEIARLRRERSESRADAPQSAETAPVAAADAPGAADETSAPSAAVATKLERWLETQGMRQDFEGLVASVYEQSRDKRRQREREEQDARNKEMQELSQGPYGRHNYKVNSLAKKLELDTKQKDYLFNLLTKYDERQREGMSDLRLDAGNAPPSPEDLQRHIKQFTTVHQQLNQQFENEMLLGLNDAQQEAFKSLPEEERGVNGKADFAFDGGGGGIEIFAGPDGAVGGVARMRMVEAVKVPEKLSLPPAPK